MFLFLHNISESFIFNQMNKIYSAIAATSLMALAACNSADKQQNITLSGLDPEKFVTDVNGKKTGLYTLTNENGMEACITNYGGRIVSIMVPDNKGNMTDVVLGFDSISDYLPENNKTDFGAAIGRYANRINQGKIVIEGDTIQLPQNNYGHCLHGGPDGWQYSIYDVVEATDNTLKLAMTSPDGDSNFPGNINVVLTYTLTPDNALDIKYEATSDAPSVINMTNHTYFNLNGNPNEEITNNTLTLAAANFTPVDSTFMTTGEILPVAGTPMDFTAGRVVGDDIDNFDFEQIKNGLGYDHNWVLDNPGNDKIPAATLYSPTTGIVLEVLTDEPGIQVYTGNFLDSTVTGKKGIVYNPRNAICLETQKFPDTPNKPQWPSATISPEKPYSSHTVFSFSTK